MDKMLYVLCKLLSMLDKRLDGCHNSYLNIRELKYVETNDIRCERFEIRCQTIGKVLSLPAVSEIWYFKYILSDSWKVLFASKNSVFYNVTKRFVFQLMSLFYSYELKNESIMLLRNFFDLLPALRPERWQFS
jgi:hypothetical protein